MTSYALTGQRLLLLLPCGRRVEEVGEDSGEGVGCQRLGAIHFPKQVEGRETLGRTRQQIRLLEQHHKHGADPEVFCLPETVMKGVGEALESVPTGLLRDDAQQVGKLFGCQRHDSSPAN